MKMFDCKGYQTTNFDEMYYCFGTIEQLKDLIYTYAHNPSDPCVYGCNSVKYWFVRGEKECEFEQLPIPLVLAILNN